MLRLLLWLVLWLLRPKGATTMPANDGFARSPDTIDAELRSIHTLQRDAGQQLDTIRRQILSLQTHEASLITAIEGRRKKVDLLLDERLWAVQVDALVTP